MVIISSNVHLKAAIIFQVTESKLCEPKTVCKEPENQTMSTINRSSHTGLVPVPNKEYPWCANRQQQKHLDI
ncbi:hypothetical protein BDB01DRAFT_854100 [Pilobolus umbonatus]|nr:hypothetical protein BDB01DRAFT_854098 [Pilobolus umbonatus]KAI8974138.1 hypothetical protein BDB01DRAFT_854099 [Pilobolus umbonatus]KAI8974139.1 hypothetical protein BDB01DRAFT_854100 [Pilobolus umbonatus]